MMGRLSGSRPLHSGSETLSCITLTRLIRTQRMSTDCHLNVWQVTVQHDSSVWATWLIHTWHTGPLIQEPRLPAHYPLAQVVWHGSGVCVTWTIYTCVMVTWIMQMQVCVVTHSSCTYCTHQVTLSCEWHGTYCDWCGPGFLERKFNHLFNVFWV